MRSKTPSLFQSEVTLFFDEDYFRTFLPPEEEGKRNFFDDGWVEAEPADADTISAITPVTTISAATPANTIR